MGKIAARKTRRYERVVRCSSMCIQVARNYRVEARHHGHTGQFGDMGACSAWRGGCDTRLRVGKSENGVYHRESNQRCKGPHCAESKFDGRGLGPDQTPGACRKAARMHEQTKRYYQVFIISFFLLLGISYSTSDIPHPT